MKPGIFDDALPPPPRPVSRNHATPASFLKNVSKQYFITFISVKAKIRGFRYLRSSFNVIGHCEGLSFG